MERKVEVTEYRAKTGDLGIDVEFVVQSLVSMTKLKHFRSAWEFLKNNGDPEHVRFYNAGVVLQHLSNQYGDIGNLKDECLLQHELDRHSSKIIELL